MIKKNKITLVIPSRDEGRGLLKLIARIPSYVDEILVVDNCSKTNPNIFLKNIDRVRVVRETRVDGRNIGYGYAHQTGISEASGDIIVAMDGDATYPVSGIKKAVDELLSQKLDLILCSRFPLNTEKAVSWFRKLGVWILNTEAKLLFGYKGQDILSGMWAIRKNVAMSMSLHEGGWNFSPEIKLSALTNKNVKLGEVHIDHYVRDYGKSKQVLWRTGLEHLLYILWRWSANIVEYSYEKAY